MKRKILVLVLCVISALCCAVCLSACGGGEENLPHIHNFVENAIPSALAEEATCQHPAKYYYVCAECGEPGTDTYLYGELGPHSFVENAIPSALAEEATCQHPAKYYYVCAECGEPGTDTYLYGELGPHSFDMQLSMPEALSEAATCQSPAKYFYTCECGEIGVDGETFTFGELGKHVYDNKVCVHCNASQSVSEGLIFEVSRNGRYAVLMDTQGCDDDDILIPDTYEGLPVLEISRFAFATSNLTRRSIIIPATVRIIDGFNLSVEKLIVEEENKWFKSVDDIIYSADGKTLVAFASNKNVESFTVPAEVTEIATCAFACNRYLKNIVIHNNVAKIGSAAFINSYALEEITIPEGITDIEGATFQNCKALRKITLPESLVSFGDAIDASTSLQFTKYDTGLYLGTSSNPYFVLAKAENKDITANTIHADTKIIAARAFEYCTKLTQIEIPDSIEVIGDYAYSDCSSVERLVIGQNLKRMGRGAFGYLSKLNEIEWNATECNDFDNWGADAFSCSGENLKLRVAGNVKRLPANMFNCNSSSNADSESQLKEVHFAANTKLVIGYRAFFKCTKLEVVECESGIAEVGEEAFYHCIALSEIRFKDGLKHIGYNAFEHCENLEKVSLPDSLESIDGNPFEFCLKLSYTDYGCGKYLGNADNPYVCLAAHNNYYENEGSTVTVHKDTKVMSDISFSWCIHTETITIPDGVKQWGGFYNNTDIQTINVPASAIYLTNSFWQCGARFVVDPANPAFKSVNGDLYSKDGTKLYKYSESHTEATFTVPAGVTTICDLAFFGLKSLETVVLPSSVKVIETRAFFDCEKLKSITVPSGIEEVGSWPVDDCEQFKYNEYGNCLYLGSADNPYLVLVKAKDTQIDSYEIAATTKIICGRAFEYCGALTQIVVPDGVESMGESVFSYCTSLEEVTLGSGIKWLVGEVFNTDSISLIKYNGTVEDWSKIELRGDRWWYGLYNLNYIECTDEYIFVNVYSY